MDIQVYDKHLIYSVVIFTYWIVISEYSALLYKILKYANMNILHPENIFFDIRSKKKFLEIEESFVGSKTFSLM